MLDMDQIWNELKLSNNLIASLDRHGYTWRNLNSREKKHWYSFMKILR